MISLVLCVVLLLVELRLRGGANYTRVSHGARRAPTRYRLGRATAPSLAAVALVVAIGLGIPLGVLVYWFTQSTHLGFVYATDNLHYLWPATLTSVGLAAGSAILALVFAIPIAILAVRSTGPARDRDRARQLSLVRAP